MEKIIADLEQRLAEAGIEIIEKYFDGFAYVVAVNSPKGEFVVYFTKSFMKYRAFKRDCLRLAHVKTHTPFKAVTPTEGGDFIMPYLGRIMALKRDEKMFSEYFKAEQVITRMI